jgi:UDP-N-acetylglucosamine 2-epimerase (non-hydrolysing)
MIDTSRQQVGQPLAARRPAGAAPGGYAVVTLGRAAKADESPRGAKSLVATHEVARNSPDSFPAHPRVTARLAGFPFQGDFRIGEPLNYLPLLGLVARCRFQEGTTALRAPCLTKRANTERAMTREEGTNLLVGHDRRRIVAESETVLDGRRRRGAVPDKCDRRAPRRIVGPLLRDAAPAFALEIAAGETVANGIA